MNKNEEDKKKELKDQATKVEDAISLLSDIDSGKKTSKEDMISAWEVFRSTVDSLQSALVSNRQASALFVQVNLKRWILRARDRNARVEENDLDTF